jgi:hypothetical protein
MTSTSRVSLSGVPKKVKRPQLEHTENLGAITHKEKKLETKQISEDYHVFQPVNNNSTYVVQRNYIEAPCESSIESQGKVKHGSCIQDLTDRSYKEAADSYTDGTWQIVKSKKSHG